MKQILFTKLFIILLSVFYFNTMYSQVNLSQGLAAYWNFNGNTSDVSGNNNNATNFGAVLTTDKWGNANSAYYFNGNSWLHVPNSPSLNFNSNTFSVHALINVQGYYPGTCHGNSIVDRGAVDNNPGAFHIRFVDGYYTGGANCSNPTPDTLHENFIAGCNNLFTPSIIAPQYIQNNTWYCLIIINDGTHLKVYVDGVLNYDATLTGIFGTSAEDLFIGRHNSGTYPYWLTGILDEVRIYDRVLNMQEVDSLCNYNPNAHPGDSIIADFKPSFPANCDPKTVQFTDQSIAANCSITSWQWYFGDGGTSNIQNPLHVYTASGDYNVQLVVISSTNKKDTFDFMLQIGESPEFAIAIGDTISCGQTSVHLTCTGGVAYSWSPCTVNCNASDFYANIYTTTQFIVQATDANGCIDKDTVYAFVTNNEEGIIVPNAFSPNEDGVNDCLKILHTTEISNFYFAIYNRIGEMVFESDSPEICWDGWYKGRKCDMATYVYYLKGNSSCGKIFKKGDITLVR